MQAQAAIKREGEDGDAGCGEVGQVGGGQPDERGGEEPLGAVLIGAGRRALGRHAASLAWATQESQQAEHPNNVAQPRNVCECPKEFLSTTTRTTLRCGGGHGAAHGGLVRR